MLVAVAGWVGADLSWQRMASRYWLIAGVTCVAFSLARRWPALLMASVFVLAAHLGVQAAARYQTVEASPFQGPVVVTGDPEPVGAGWRIELRLPSRALVQGTAYGPPGWALEHVSVGETLLIEGQLKPLSDQPWLRTRHIAGKMSIRTVERSSGPGLTHLIPSLVRQRIAAGASHMSDSRRSLYLGLVIGDDRRQTTGQRMRFRAAGLTHLLAVSGQNVAFVLAVARPLLQMLGHRARFVGLLFVLCIFALVTRLEPSVLRATATASIAAWAVMSGRERSGVVVLCAAVLCLIGIDPFLVDSVGFQLSIAASAGILVAGPAIERRVPVPPWLAAPLATTLSAQLFVSPLLAYYFGPVSIASISANLLVGWAAAAIMTTGLTVGVLAGLAPPAIAIVLQWPIERLLWWIETVATFHAALPAPRLGPLQVMALAGLVIGARSAAVMMPLRIVAASGALATLLAAVPLAPDEPGLCGPGIVWYPPQNQNQTQPHTHAHTHTQNQSQTPGVLIIGADAYATSVERCFDAGVRQIDLLILERGNAATARLVYALDEVSDIALIAAPPQHRVIGARRQVEAFTVPAGDGTLEVQPSADGSALDVRIRLR
ncbi:MAG: ComEC/Rec2 family competence protein [Acidimicrobiales bacterium]